MMEPKSKRMKLDVSTRNEDDSTFGTLPLDILHQICSYLTTEDRLMLRMVSKNLRFFLSDPSFWKVVCISPVESKNVKLVKTVVKLSKPFVTTLSINGYCPPGSSSLAYLSSCHLITALDLCGSCFSESVKRKLVSKLPNLSRLSIGGATCYQELLPMLGSLSQLVVHSETEYFYNFFRSWHRTDFQPSRIAFIGKSTYSNDLFPLIISANSHEIVLSLYQCTDTSNQTFMPLENVTNHKATVKVNGGSAGSWYMSVGKAVSTSVLSKNNLYTYSCPVSPDSTIVSTCLLTADVGLGIAALDFSGCTLPVALDTVRSIVKCTPNLLVFSVNGVVLTDPLEPLDEIFRLLSLHCQKLRSVFSLVENCYVYDVGKAWENIFTLKNLEHLSLCSCCFMTHREDYYRRNKLQILNIQFTINNMLPKCFKSMIIKACGSRNAQYRYALQDIFTFVSDNIIHLKCLHVYIPVSSGSIGRDLSMRKLLSCLRLDELAIVCTTTTVVIHEAIGIHNLKCLKLKNVHLAVSFFSDLAPDRRNMFLQTLSLRVRRLPVEHVVKLLESCPCLVSCEIFFLCATSRMYADDCKHAKYLAKKFKLLSFNLERCSGRSYKVTRSTDLNNCTVLKKL